MVCGVFSFQIFTLLWIALVLIFGIVFGFYFVFVFLMLIFIICIYYFFFIWTVPCLFLIMIMMMTSKIEEKRDMPRIQYNREERFRKKTEKKRETISFYRCIAVYSSNSHHNSGLLYLLCFKKCVLLILGEILMMVIFFAFFVSFGVLCFFVFVFVLMRCLGVCCDCFAPRN